MKLKQITGQIAILKKLQQVETDFEKPFNQIQVVDALIDEFEKPNIRVNPDYKVQAKTLRTKLKKTTKETLDAIDKFKNAPWFDDIDDVVTEHRERAKEIETIIKDIKSKKGL